MAREGDDFFLSRWSRRKAQAQRGLPLEADPPAPETLRTAVATAATAAPAAPAATVEAAAAATTAPPAAPAASEAPAAPARPQAPPPTLDDVAKLARDADFSRFVARDVDTPVRHAALKKLFSDPQFNVMDGLDVYIDDYGRPDPLPASLLRKMVQARGLGLFQDETAAPDAAAPAIAAGGARDTLPAPLHEPAPVTEPAEPSEPAAVADASAGPPEPAGALAPPLPPDEDPALQLQPHDAAGPAGDQRRAGEDPRRLD